MSRAVYWGAIAVIAVLLLILWGSIFAAKAACEKAGGVYVQSLGYVCIEGRIITP